MDDALPADDVTGRTIGNYRVESLLGSGGMGAVYQAYDTNLNRPVALKVLPAAVATDADRLRRFRAEALAASSLNHPHILVIHDFGEVDGRPFIVTELVEGETLRQRLRRGPLAVREAVDIAMQIAGALAAAHARGIVHRDIKPENVMLRPDGYVKVLDFGLAKLLTQAAPDQEPTILSTVPGLVMGTPGYMSPEQARGLDVDARSDVWSVGVVLYELVSGRRPFGGATSADVMAAILSREPESLDHVVPKPPRAVGEIVAKALAKDMAGRFASAHELHQSLTAARATIESDAVPSPAGGLMIDSLAVLPFANAGGDPDTEYLSDGITESLINSLSQIPALRVVPRSSAFRYKARDVDPMEVGRQLKVSALVTGKVLHRGDTLTIQAELVDVRHEAQQLWGERFSRKAADIFAVEEELARQIAGKLRGRLTGEEHHRLARRYTEDTEAYHLYLRGRYYWNKRTRENLIKAAGYFEQAIARDDSYGLPYAGLADAYLVLSFFDGGVPRDLLTKAKAAALRALAIDPELSEAHAALGLIEVCLDRNWSAAEQRYRHAIESDAAYWLTHTHYAFLLAAQGRFDEALSEVRRGLELEPLSLVVHHHVAWVSVWARRYEDTIAICRKALELEPNFGVAYVWIGIALEQQGHYDDAVAALESAAARVNNSYALAALGHACAVSGRIEEARRRLRELETPRTGYVDPYCLAVVHAGLGETNRALECLETAHRDYSGTFALWAKVDPRLDVLRGEPRFQDVLQRAGLGGPLRPGFGAPAHTSETPRSSSPVAAPGVSTPSRTARWWPIAAALAVLVIGIAGWQFRTPAPRLPIVPGSTAVDVASGKSRLAVLPFENLTRVAADDWLSGGLSDSLTYGLQNLNTLILTTRERISEVYRQQQVHDAAPLDPKIVRTLVEALGVTYYVHGTYQRVGDDIRVVARLVSIDTGEVSAQESVTDRFANILKVEDELAIRFAAKLDASGHAARPSAGTSSVDAYRAYSEAQVMYVNVQDREAVQQRLREAVRLDPRYAQAWALLSKSLSRVSLGIAQSPDDEDSREAWRTAQRAVELDPLLYDAHVALALAHRRGERTGAWRTEAEKAIQLNPRVAEAYTVLAASYSATPSWTCSRDRDPALAEQYYGISVRLEPRSALTYGGLVDHLNWKGDPEKALAIANQGLAALPDNDYIKARRVYALLNLGRIDDARATLQGMTGGQMSTTGDQLLADFWLEALGGRIGPAAQRFADADNRDAVFQIRQAWVLTAAKRVSAALPHVEQALQRDPTCRDYIANSAGFAPLRNTKEFSDILARSR